MPTNQRHSERRQVHNRLGGMFTPRSSFPSISPAVTPLPNSSISGSTSSSSSTSSGSMPTYHRRTMPRLVKNPHYQSRWQLNPTFSAGSMSHNGYSSASSGSMPTNLVHSAARPVHNPFVGVYPPRRQANRTHSSSSSSNVGWTSGH